MSPRALAIETSGRIGSIALVQDACVVSEDCFEHGLQHAARILPMIDGLTRARGWLPSDIEHLYVSAGPGSFTGLRIGITLCKTIALATGAKVVAVPSVRVLVENAPADATNAIIVLDAKRGQIFTARFTQQSSVEGRQWKQQEPAHLDTLTAMLSRSPRPVHLLGEGIPFHQSAIPPDDAGIVLTNPDLWRARASAVATIGTEMAQARQFADPFKLSPIYIRRPEAEEKWEQIHGS